MKKLQQDLRVSKKAEQLAKEKLVQAKRNMDKVEKDFAKYREESEARAESLRNEISILQKHYEQLQNSANDIDAGSDNSKTADLMKIIEDYSRQAEAKSKENEALAAKLDKKAGKLIDLKKRHTDTEARNIKLRSSLDSLKAYFKLLSGNFIKSLRQQNMSLREQVVAYQRECFKETEQLLAQTESHMARTLGQSQR